MATIRHARREDAPVILELIQALADYEREPDAVEGHRRVTREEDELPLPVRFKHGNDATVPNTEPITSLTDHPRCLLLFLPPRAKAVGMARITTATSTWRSKAGIYLEGSFRPAF
ncbi:hypothetical protein J3459_006158 [Metarhizium acridum]|nr:hypothetical protein J3459_006158 [Metarhizium acridum]